MFVCVCVCVCKVDPYVLTKAWIFQYLAAGPQKEGCSVERV